MKFSALSVLLFAVVIPIHALATERPTIEIATISWRFGEAEDKAFRFSVAGFQAASNRAGAPASHYSCASPRCTWQSNLLVFSLYSLGTWAIVELYEDAK